MSMSGWRYGLLQRPDRPVSSQRATTTHPPNQILVAPPSPWQRNQKSAKSTNPTPARLGLGTPFSFIDFPPRGRTATVTAQSLFLDAIVASTLSYLANVDSVWQS
ncbi:hypothetical protein CGRA01v4_08172 [Colletotrichum graminicola]|nr:hypothetical protein CGRA01v4_08172 [Colletotrichum graminicola]